MLQLQKLTYAILSLILVISFSGCGGSGGSSPSQAESVEAIDSDLIEGTALAGTPISGQVWLKDSTGRFSNSSPITIDDSGYFRFDVNGLLPPFYLQTQGMAGGRYYELYSMTFKSGRANVNPITDLALRVAHQSKLSELFELPQNFTITEDSFNDTLQAILAIIQPLIDEFGADGDDPLISPIEANHTGLDGVFDAMRIEINEESGEVTIAGIDDPVPFIASYLDNIVNTPPIDREYAYVLAEEVDLLTEIIAFIEDSYSAAALRDSYADYIADNYLNSGLDKAAELERADSPLSDSDTSENLDHFSIEQIKDDGIYVVNFEKIDSAGIATPTAAYIKRINNQWLYVGNQYISTVNVATFNYRIPVLYDIGSQPNVTTDVTYDDCLINKLYNSCDVNDDALYENYGNAQYLAGIDFVITDNAGQGFQMVVVDGGAGLINNAKYIAINGVFLPAPIVGIPNPYYGSGYLFIDSEIENLPDENLIYTFTIYNSYDPYTFAPIGEPTEVRSAVIARPPLTRAETWIDSSSYYSEIMNLPEDLEYLTSTVEIQPNGTTDNLLGVKYLNTNSLIIEDEIHIEYSKPTNLIVSKFEVTLSLTKEESVTEIDPINSFVYYWNTIYSTQSSEQTLSPSSNTAIFPKIEVDATAWMDSLSSIEIAVQDIFNRRFYF